ncbi:hypothetical protein AB0C12_22315 [Actinoplanes sp. NPDC048967]|uniref:hypothetical protein n=1 Tax=Actinoplanes sp. NPDC048967 TaxID=3155269 RepID=UPI0033DB43AF
MTGSGVDGSGRAGSGLEGSGSEASGLDETGVERAGVGGTGLAEAASGPSVPEAVFCGFVAGLSPVVGRPVVLELGWRGRSPTLIQLTAPALSPPAFSALSSGDAALSEISGFEAASDFTPVLCLSIVLDWAATFGVPESSLAVVPGLSAVRP